MPPSQEFLWKPQSESNGNLVVLTPNNLNGRIENVSVVAPSGQITPGNFSGNQSNGQRGHFRFGQPGSQFPNGSRVVVALSDGSSVVYDVPNASQRFTQTGNETIANTGNPNQLVPGQESNNVQFASASQGGGGGGAGGGRRTGGRPQLDAQGNKIPGNNIGTAQGETGGPGVSFPQADFDSLSFNPIEPSFIPNIDVPTVDPIDRTAEVGDFNREQFQSNLAQGGINALDLLELEFTGLEQFNREARSLQKEGIIDENLFNQTQVAAANKFNRGELPAANAFNREQVGEANVFNQQQRIQQLETALPGARDTINRQIERGGQLAEGVLPDTIEDRAFEIASRSASADATSARGFGDESVFGRRTSDILSAQQRLEVGQVGEQTLSRFLTLGANLAFDQPIKQNPILDQPLQFLPQQASTAQDVSGRPDRAASTLAVDQQAQLNPLTTIQPGQAIGFDVNQNQFQGNLDQRTNEFNSNLDFESQAFNSSADLTVQLEQLGAETFNAQQESNAINSSTELGIAQDQFDAGINAGQDAATTGAIGTIVGAGISAVASFLGRGGASAGAEVAAGAAGAGAVAATSAGGILAGAQAGAAAGAQFGGVAAGAGATGAAATGAEGGVAAAAAAPIDLTAIGGAGPASVLAAAAIATGVGVADVAAGLTDGSITEQDVKRGFASLFPGGAIPVGVNDILGGQFSENDVTNAALLTNPVTAPIALADMALSAFGVDFGSGKNPDQKARDSLRDFGTGLGLFSVGQGEGEGGDGLREGSHQLQLADGSFYDIGLDGGERIQNYGINPVNGDTERFTYDVDWSDPRAGESVGLLNPVALMAFGKNYQRMMGHMWNASISNNNSLSETKRNIRQQAGQIGVDYQQGLRLLEQHRQAGNIDRQEYLAMVNGWNDLMLVEGVETEIII